MRMLYSVHGPHSSVRRLETSLRKDLGPLLDLYGTNTQAVTASLAYMADTAIGFDFCREAVKEHVHIELGDQDTGKQFDFPFRPKEMEILPLGNPPLRQALKQTPVDVDQPQIVDMLVRPCVRVYGEQCRYPIDDRSAIYVNEMTVDNYQNCVKVIPALVTCG